MFDLISFIFGDPENKNFLKQAKKTVAKINELEAQYAALSDADLPAKTDEFRRALAAGTSPEKIVPQAFALVKNAARRLMGREVSVCGIPQKWDMVHFDVQLVAGLALWRNMVAEVSTGEGKTLIATLPAYMNALFGRGCYIATVNEYLAKRDSQWMGALYNMLGLSCAYVYANQSDADKKRAYAADITYGTSSEFGFDYLRDNSSTVELSDKVQRGFFYCLIDEADSILIDEARTPLIISGEDEDAGANPFSDLLAPIERIVDSQQKLCAQLAEKFRRAERENTLTDENFNDLYKIHSCAPRNRQLLQILKNGGVRRRFERLKLDMAADCNKVLAHELKNEMYYAVNEKNKTATFTEKGQDFFGGSMFLVNDIEADIKSILRDKSMDAPRKNDAVRAKQRQFAESTDRVFALNKLLQAYTLYEKNVDYIVKDGKVEIIDPNTGRVMEGRRWSDYLHQAVEAKERVNIESENTTYATISIQNFFKMFEKIAGMTATAMSEADEFREIYGMKAVRIPPNKPCIRKQLPDLIYLTRREKFNAIIDEIVRAKAAGQPVLAVTASVDDSEVLSRMLKIRRIPHNKLNAANDELEAGIVARAGQMGAVTISTNMAGRGTDIKLGGGVEELGGLLVIGAEHCQSVRVDRQLAGRCARQGDRGTVRFFASFEDTLFRVYADVSFLKNSIKQKHIEGAAFSSSLFPSIIAAAQKKAEDLNFSARKELLKLDAPVNTHRNIVYSMRDGIMAAEKLGDVLLPLLDAEIDACVDTNLPADDMDISPDAVSKFRNTLFCDYSLSVLPAELGGLPKAEIRRKLKEKVAALFEKGPFAEGKGGRGLVLYVLDKAFREHLSRLEFLREAVYLRAYGQRDPQQEFAQEAYKSWDALQRAFARSLIALSGRAGIDN